MKEKIQEYIQDIEKQLEYLGVRIIFENGLMASASGKSVFNTINIDRAIILTAKLEGFNDALNLLKEVNYNGKKS